MKYQIFEINNNCSVIYKQIPGSLAHFAVFSECGSRHEQNYPQGASHFIEHMIFKGTSNRKTYHILSGLENIGCDVNAYTSKEEMVLHASFLEEFAPKIMDLFSEMIFESVFPDNEIEKERNVIIDEVAVVKDNPSEYICDKFESLLFENHPLSRDILGEVKDLKKLKKKNILEFYNNVFLPSRKVIVYFGNKPLEKVRNQINKHFFSRLEKYSEIQTNNIYFSHEQEIFNKIEKRSSHQTHMIMGSLAYSIKEKQKNACSLLINILGGQAFNSRLNLSVREKYGLSYSVDAYYNAYVDNGYYSVCFSSDNGNTQKILDVVHKELKKLRETKIGSLQLHNAKRQIIGQTAVYLDSQANDLISAGKTFMHTSQIPDFNQLREMIENISSEELQDVANEIMKAEKLSYLCFNSKSNGKH
jgi:predicted Zn-dependent peptidase